MRDHLVDDAFAAFVAALPPGLREATVRLPEALGLVPTSGVPLSGVFSHPITLSAVELVAEGTRAPRETVRRATLVHVLSVLQAFAIDRIEDGQVKLDDDACRALTAMAQHRDARLAELGVRPDVARAAEEETYAAIAMEARILGRKYVSLKHVYQRLSRRKQALGLLGARGLCVATGATDGDTRDVVDALESAATALQFEDDVADWEDDFVHGRSWMLALVDPDWATWTGDALEGARAVVFRSGILAETLAAAGELYAAVAERFAARGGLELAAWAAGRQRECRELATHEERTPGFANRKRSLRHFARTLLG